MGMGVPGLGGGKYVCNAGAVDEMMADFYRRRSVAASDAGRAHDADAGRRAILEVPPQVLGAEHRTGQRVANGNSQRRSVPLAFLHDIEMRIEGRGLEH